MTNGKKHLYQMGLIRQKRLKNYPLLSQIMLIVAFRLLAVFFVDHIIFPGKDLTRKVYVSDKEVIIPSFNTKIFRAGMCDNIELYEDVDVQDKVLLDIIKVNGKEIGAFRASDGAAPVILKVLGKEFKWYRK